jgi:hypothetical protein
MTSQKSSRKFWVFFISFCLLAAYGCSHSSPPPPNPVAQSQPQGGQPSTPPATGPRPQFLDFPDIPIPSELDLQPKDSYVFQAGSTKTGLLTLRGRVDINSLVNFFNMAMPRENWKPKGQFRYRRSALIFEKPEKTCVILLREDIIWTWVEIYVAPATTG